MAMRNFWFSTKLFDSSKTRTVEGGPIGKEGDLDTIYYANVGGASTPVLSVTLISRADGTYSVQARDLFTGKGNEIDFTVIGKEPK